MGRWLFLIAVCTSSAAFGGDVKVRIHVNPGWQFPDNSYRRGPQPVWVPRAAPIWWVAPTPIVIAPPPPQVVIFERPAPPPAPEPEPLPPPPPVPPQVVVVHVEPAPPPPPPPVTIVPVAPAAPGPDVYSWTDDDGVVNYSTRVPADAKKRAKKLK